MNPARIPLLRQAASPPSRTHLLLLSWRSSSRATRSIPGYVHMLCTFRALEVNPRTPGDVVG